MRRDIASLSVMAAQVVLGLGLVTGCARVSGLMPGSSSEERLVDIKEFDPGAGVLWAEGGQLSAEDLRKPHPILIVGVNLIDGTDGAPRPRQDILIIRGFIDEIAATGDIIPPKGTERIKGENLSAMPGLVDLLAFAGRGGGGPLWEPGQADEEHVLGANLYAGVTTVVLGGDGDRLAELRDKIKKGQALGPQLFLAAPTLTVRNGFPAELGKKSKFDVLGKPPDRVREVDNPSDAAKKANAVADHPAKFEIIPVFYDATPSAFPKMSADSLRNILERARNRGRKSVVFTGKEEDLSLVLAARPDIVVHGVYGEGLNDEKVSKIGMALLSQNAAFAPAIVGLWGQGRSISGGTYPALKLEQEITDPDLFGAFAKPKEGKGMLYQFAKGASSQTPVAEGNLAKLATWKTEGGNKVPFVVATTAGAPGVFPGAAVHREMLLLVKAGLTPMEAIAAATSRPARVLGGDQVRFGTLAKGMRADILLVHGDPTTDIEATQHIHTVIANGRVVERFPYGTWSKRQKEREKAAKAEKKAAAGGKAGQPAAAPVKRKRNTGDDEDPEPVEFK